MNKKPLLFVANWKMQLPHNQAVALVSDNLNELDSLAEHGHITLVLCPSFDALSSITQMTNPTHIHVGAQNCAPDASGAYTGEVQPSSLAQMGCDFCIVGHSERRQLFHETDAMIMQKVHRLLENDIIPIVCVGETKQEREQGATQKKLQEQLAPVFELLSAKEHTRICIAYEPVWAIGTGTTPSLEELLDTTLFIKSLCHKQASHCSFRLLYGGSVNENNATSFTSLDTIDGLLIGKASTDFQKLQKIVSLYC